LAVAGGRTDENSYYYQGVSNHVSTIIEKIAAGSADHVTASRLARKIETDRHFSVWMFHCQPGPNARAAKNIDGRKMTFQKPRMPEKIRNFN
jgi:hypothetical protein